MNRKIIVPVVIVSIFVLIGVYFGLGNKSMEPPVKNTSTESSNAGSYGKIVEAENVIPEIDSIAPDFTWTDSEGNFVKLSDFKGKPVFINFWATWCPPCRAEMPDLQSFYEDNGEEVIVLTVNLTSSERSAKDIDKFIVNGNFTFPVLLDQHGLLAQRYLVRAIPTSYFIDEIGIIREIYTGAMNKDQMNGIIDKLSNEK